MIDSRKMAILGERHRPNLMKIMLAGKASATLPPEIFNSQISECARNYLIEMFYNYEEE